MFKNKPLKLILGLMLHFFGVQITITLTEGGFQKSQNTSLSLHCPYDCSINLLPSSAPPWGKLYSLSTPERLSIDKYISEFNRNHFTLSYHLGSKNHKADAWSLTGWSGRKGFVAWFHHPFFCLPRGSLGWAYVSGNHLLQFSHWTHDTNHSELSRGSGCLPQPHCQISGSCLLCGLT